MKNKLIIIGMGGHSKVVTDVAFNNNYEILGYLDDQSPHSSSSKYLGNINSVHQWLHKDVFFFIAIGDNITRKKVSERLKPLNLQYATIIDSRAIIGSGVQIFPGTLVMPGAIINADAKIGEHVIINTGATVDHDCQIQSYAHISPGVHLAGGVKVGIASHIGIGASVIPKVHVGDYSVVGAGAAVIHDLPSRCVAVGVPARIIRSNLNEKEE